MRYVRRDSAGKVDGHYANPQSYATEALPDDHPDLQDYRARREANLRRPHPLEARVAELERLVRGLLTRG